MYNGGMSRKATIIRVSDSDLTELKRRVSSRSGTQRGGLRSRIILLAHEGREDKTIAQLLGVNRHTVRLWRRRYARKGLNGLKDEPGRGHPETISSEKKKEIIAKAVQPPKNRKRWSCRSMASSMKVSASTVQRLWSANDIKPHLKRTFKISKDPQFESKFWDVIGLYLNPPDRALVLCCDEKSQCQALERTQPGLPLGVGHIRTETHDYIRHGTVTLFAALNYLDGKLVSMIEKNHRHQEWLRFLKLIDKETPAESDIHLILDNYATHKHPKVRSWLRKHPRFHLHFTPTSASWMNMVERFFADITQDLIRDGSFDSAKQLSQEILQYLAERNANPKRYVWRAKGEEILRKIKKAREAANV